MYAKAHLHAVMQRPGPDFPLGDGLVWKADGGDRETLCDKPSPGVAAENPGAERTISACAEALDQRAHGMDARGGFWFTISHGTRECGLGHPHSSSG